MQRTLQLHTASGIGRDPIRKLLDSFVITPNTSGHQFNSPNVRCRDRIIGDFELIYVADGESDISVGNKEYTCMGGDMVLIPPFINHSICSSRLHPHDHYYYHFDVYPFYRHQDFLRAVLPDGSYRFRMGCHDDLIGLYSRMDQEKKGENPGFSVIIHLILLQVLTLVLRSSCLSRPEGEPLLPEIGPTDPVIDRCTEYIGSHLAEGVQAAHLCRHLHISESSLYKRFMDVCGIPPGRFIRLLRIRQAEYLLKTTELSMKEIAEKLGFSSPYHFSASFKDYYGTSPKDYRNHINL